MSIERLKKRADFLRIAKSGKKYICPAFVLQIDNNVDCNISRVGVTASKKVGNAVKRNFAKRRIKSLIRLCAEKIKPGYDYVIIARHEILVRDFEKMQTELTQALTRIHGS